MKAKTVILTATPNSFSARLAKVGEPMGLVRLLESAPSARNPKTLRRRARAINAKWAVLYP